jgi:hypothetical protein
LSRSTRKPGTDGQKRTLARGVKLRDLRRFAKAGLFFVGFTPRCVIYRDGKTVTRTKQARNMSKYETRARFIISGLQNHLKIAFSGINRFFAFMVCLLFSSKYFQNKITAMNYFAQMIYILLHATWQCFRPWGILGRRSGKRARESMCCLDTMVHISSLF